MEYRVGKKSDYLPYIQGKPAIAGRMEYFNEGWQVFNYRNFISINILMVYKLHFSFWMFIFVLYRL